LNKLTWGFLIFFFILIVFICVGEVFIVKNMADINITNKTTTIDVKKEVDVLHLIRTNCEKYNVPYYLALALCKRESGINPDAININVDGSKDIGLFQLNNRYFSEKESKKIESNVETAIKHLSELYKQSKSWFIALVKYHRGNKPTDDDTIKYLEDIINYKTVLEYY
jgi:soluble lytic murein transglycosylase-like protein